jgi:capsular polysaccharide biosynthesis protein
LRNPPVLALKPCSFDSYCRSIQATPVASARLLLADPIKTARVWTPETAEPIPRYSRIVAVQGARQPSYDDAARVYPQSRQAFLRLRSATVFPRTGLVMPEEGVVLRNDLRQWVPDHRLTPGFVDFVDGAMMARISGIRPLRRIHQTALVLCHAYEHNYGHWLLDCLPRLLPWVGLLREKRLVALVRPLQGWQSRTLELLDVPRAAVSEVPEPSIICNDIIVPGLRASDDTQPAPARAVNLRPPAAAVIDTVDLLREGASATAMVEQPERIYVSRRGVSSFHELHNEHEVEAAMSRLGFAIVRPETLAFDQQVVAFSRARVIAGPHGAGLTNAVFAPKGCLVIDMLPETWHTNWMLRVTQVFGHDYLPIVHACDPTLSKPVLLGSDIIAHSHVVRVPADAFADLVAEAIGRLENDRKNESDARSDAKH